MTRRRGRPCDPERREANGEWEHPYHPRVETNAFEAVHETTSHGTEARSTRSLAFDVLFGIALPVVCLLADPGVFRGGLLVPPVLGRYAVASYVLLLPAMVFLGIWLVWQRGALLLAGPLLASGAVAIAIGLALLPLSLPMSLVLVGLLGLVPFGTGVAFFRNGLRAFRAAGANRRPAFVCIIVAVLGLAAIALPLVAQHRVDRRTTAVVEAALSGDAGREAVAVARLRPFGWLADPHAVTTAWRSTTDYVVQRRLARAWQNATGQDLHLSMVD